MPPLATPAQRQQTIDHARQIVQRAKTQGRDLTDTELAQVRADREHVAELDREMKAQADLARSVFTMDAPAGEWPDPDQASTGPFTPEAKAGFTTALRTKGAYRTTVQRKDLTGTGGLLPSSGTAVVGGAYPANMTALADLFTSQAADGPVQRYYRFGPSTAAVVAEGAQKPDAGTTVTGVDVPLTKIATTTKVSDELSEDASFLVTFLAQELTAAVVSEENAQIVAALGDASGVLTDTGPAAEVLDLVAEAIAAQEGVAGLTPSAVIVNPTTLASIRAMKASTAGTYFVDPWAAGPPTLHGLQLASTPAVPATTVWVASKESVVIYRRGAVQVETGLDGTDFTHNMRTVRAEERMATAVVRPAGLTEITLA